MKRNHGFTLIELLIVVVIIGILATVAVGRFEKVKKRGQVAAVQSDLRNLSVSQEAYHTEHITYTTNLGDLEFSLTSGVTITVNEANAQGWGATATHAGDATIQCGIYVGSASPSAGAPAATPEAVACNF
jgi:prepilin-type N-terminal cleavage/methylation domain-containing protein